MSGSQSNSGDALVSPDLLAEPMLVAVRAGEATLERGVKSGAVLALQKALVALGASITPDGSFGPKTYAEIVAQQKAAGLPQDGVVDAATLAVIDENLAARRKNKLMDAIAAAAGASGSPRLATEQSTAPARGPSRTDTDYFDDASALVGPNPGPVDDPDSPPPDAPTSPGKSQPLPADRAKMLARVKDFVKGDASASAALERIAAAGRFSAGSLLPNLTAMVTTPRAPDLLTWAGIEPSLLVAQVIRHVDNPLRIQQGIGHGTCGAGVIEYLIARRDGAEFTRIVDGITREARSVKLKSGRQLEMPRTAIPRDTSGRVDVDRLFQSAIMNHATAMSWLFDYDNPNDDDSFWAAVQGDSQMPVWGFSNLYQDVMGERVSSVTVITRSRDDIAELVASRGIAGEKVPVILKFNTLHWLSIERVERGGDGQTASVVLRNPWGRDEGGDNPRRVAMPERGGRVRMTFADLKEAVFGAVVRD